MPAFNKVLLIGNLTRDVELKQTQGGTTIASFGMAINNKWTGKDGTKHDEVTFVNITCFDQLANTASTYLRKGSPILVEGRLKLDQWQDKQGQKRSQLSVVAEKIQFLGANQNQQSPAPARTAQPPANNAPSGTQPDTEPPAEWEPAPAPAAGDDIPF